MKTSRSSPRRFARALALSAIGLAVAGCGRQELSHRPPTTAEKPSFDTRPSILSAQLSMALIEVSSLVNAKVPQSFSTSGNGADLCASAWVVFREVRACVGTKYSFAAQRTGLVSVTAAGPQGIRVSVPISFSGSGGFRGYIAPIISADRKNFRGALILNAQLKPRLTEDWCPQLDTAVSYAWTSNPRVEIVGGVWIDVKHQVEKKLEEKLPELVAEAKNAIDCGKFKTELSKLYGSRSFPVEIPEIGHLYVNVLPRDIAFSGFHVTPTDLKVSAAMTADVDVAGKPLAPEPLPLPKLRSMDVDGSRLQLSVPVRLPYATLSASVTKAIGGKTFAQDTPAGKVEVKVSSVELYPSHGKLVVGIDFDADLPSKILDTKGKVYLLATPKVDGTKISFRDASYAAVLDNQLWSLASGVFEGQIRTAIRNAAGYDLGPEVEKAKDAIAGKLADPALAPGLVVSANDVDMKIGRVVVADKELAVEGLLSANVKMSVQP